MINFNQFCNETEIFLSKAAAIPVLGSLAGISKVLLGTTQAVAALALGILSSPFRFCHDDAKAFNDHCWTHVVHGLGNMVAGLGEALLSLTLIGGFMFHVGRKMGAYNDNPDHQDKYIPYSDLIARDVAALRSDYDATNTSSPRPWRLSPTAFRHAIGVNAVPAR